MIKPSCPLCGHPARITLALSSSSLLPHYRRNYRLVPARLPLGSYRIFRCSSCNYEWADPQKPANPSYYAWLTTKPGYYPASRWEWGIVVDLISRRPGSVLEIGCGSGGFLNLCHQHLISAVGLDTTPSSVKAACRRGLDARLLSLSAFRSSTSRKFDYIVAFHLLEHVPHPHLFVKQLLTLLKPQGKIFISTPYTSPKHTLIWFDYLNYPPHHLSRWNIKSYRRLAEKYALDLRLFMPRSSRLRSRLNRVSTELRLAAFGPSDINRPLLQLLWYCLCHPRKLLQAVLFEIDRETITVEDPFTAAVRRQPVESVVLVELTKS